MVEKGNNVVCSNIQCGYVMMKPKEKALENSIA